jgi:hypothetical protein
VSAPGPITRSARRLAEGIGLGLAALSWRFVDGPLRSRFAALTAGAAVLALAAFVIVWTEAKAGSAELKASTAPAPDPGELERMPPMPAPPEDAVERSSGPMRTSCDAVVHVGDSTSDGLISPTYLPKEKDRIDAQYARYGATRARMEIEGATSIVESPDGSGAEDAAEAVVAGGYRGCWVVALGTNEAANVDAGSAVGVSERIDLMMSAMGKRPVLWLTVRTLDSSGPYANANMESFNEALIEACDSYPNLRVFDWASAVKGKWYIEDGIHFTSDGYAARAHRTARALAEAFPRDGAPSAGCVVN